MKDLESETRLKFQLPLSDVGMVGDMDDIEFLEDIEEIFNVKFSNKEAESLITIGDLFVMLREKLRSDSRNAKCGTALSFYSLRQVIYESSAVRNVRPKTKVNDLGITDLRSFLDLIKQRKNLRVPGGIASVQFGTAAFLLLIASVAYGLFSVYGFFVFADFSVLHMVVAAVILIGSFLYTEKAPMIWTSDQLTVGDIAKILAAFNRGLLAKRGAANGSKEVWDSIMAALEIHFGVDPRRVAPSTTFYPKGN